MRNSSRHTLLALALIGASCLAGCSKESKRTGRIRPYVRGVETKAAVTTTESLENEGSGSFTMQAILDATVHDNATGAIYKGKYFTEQVTNSVAKPSEWNIAGDWRWVSGEKLRFWCWTNDLEAGGMSSDYDASLIGSDTRTFSFQMPTDANASNRSDVVLAYAEKAWTEGSTDYVDLTFRHPLSNIRFESNVESDNIEITSISLKNIYRRGQFTFNESATPHFVWSNLADQGTVTETADVSKENLGNINFFVPPQVLSDASMIGVTFRKKSTSEVISLDRTVYTQSQESAHAWKQGYYYKYRISLSHDFTDVITFTVTLQDWEPFDGESGEIPIEPNA